MGYDYNPHEIERACRYKQEVGKLCYFPLIEHRITKSKAMSILKEYNIEIPAMYKLGYKNNNCIGCFKGGLGYWNKIKKDFPDIFKQTAELERKKGYTILKKNSKPLYLDQLPDNCGRYKPIVECDGLFCTLVEESTKNITDKEDYIRFDFEELMEDRV